MSYFFIFSSIFIPPYNAIVSFVQNCKTQHIFQSLKYVKFVRFVKSTKFVISERFFKSVKFVNFVELVKFDISVKIVKSVNGRKFKIMITHLFPFDPRVRVGRAFIVYTKNKNNPTNHFFHFCVLFVILKKVRYSIECYKIQSYEYVSYQQEDHKEKFYHILTTLCKIML